MQTYANNKVGPAAKRLTERLTKREALAALGVVGARTYKHMAEITDLAHVAEGRKIVRNGDHFRTVVAGITGSVTVETATGAVIDIEAPFVIDTWGTDDKSVATIEVTANTASELILLNVEHREAAFRLPGDLAKHSHTTVQALFRGLDSATSEAATAPTSPSEALAG